MSDMDYGGGSAPPAPQPPIPSEGLHDAVCYAVVDWGVMVDEFDGIPKGVVQGVRFFFELDEKMADGRPFALSTYSIKIKYGDKAGFVKLLKAWLGKECPASLVGYPLGGLRGRMASLNVEHRQKPDGTYSARIDAVMKPRAGATPMQPVNMELPPWVKEARAKDNKAAEAFLAGQGYSRQDFQKPTPQAEEPGGGFDVVPFEKYGRGED